MSQMDNMRGDPSSRDPESKTIQAEFEDFLSQHFLDSIFSFFGWLDFYCRWKENIVWLKMKRSSDTAAQLTFLIKKMPSTVVHFLNAVDLVGE